jgi:integral membrane protein (TIGR00529 family)
MDITSVLLSLSGVILSFITIIFLIRRKVQFGLSLLIGSIILALFSLFLTDVIKIGQAVAQATIYSFEAQQFQFKTIELAILMTLIFMFASLMQDTGGISKLIQSLRSFFSKGGTLGLIPAIYGLMPVPGGALFSAPVVDEEGNKFNIEKNKKNFFNIWFRHIWFPIYPISYSIVVMADLVQIDIFQLIMANMFAFFVMVIIGFILLRKILHDNNKEITPDKKRKEKNYRGFIFLLPPIIPVFFSLLIYIGFPQNHSFIIGILFAMVLLFFLSDISMKQYMIFLKKSVTIKFALVIFGIMIFREIFEVSGANTAIFSIFEQLPIPPLLIIIIIPLVLGMTSGYVLSGLTLSFVLIEPLFSLTELNIIALASIFYMSAFIGYLISPLHLCNVLSSEYLKTDTTRMYGIFIPSALLLLIIHILFVYFFI